MLTVDAKNDPEWLAATRAELRYAGCAVVDGVLSPDLVDRTREAMYRVQERILQDVGQERLERAGEIGVLRLMARYDPFFLELLAIPEVQAIVDCTVSNTAILHLQNGFIPPPQKPSASKSFQHTFHRDFPRHLHGYLASVNVMLTLDEFTSINGGTLVAPGTHRGRTVQTKTISTRSGNSGRVCGRFGDRLRLDSLACRWREPFQARPPGDQPSVHPVIHKATDRLRTRTER